LVIETFVISLETLPRNNDLLNQLRNDGLNPTLVSAVDGRQWVPPFQASLVNLYRFRKLVGRYPSGAELGCALSHLRVALLAKQSNADFALVLEEDASLVGSLKPAISQLMKMDTNRPVVLQLFCHQDCVLRKKSISQLNLSGEVLGEFYYPPHGTVAYLINRQAIEKLSSRQIVEGLADWPPSAYQFDFFGYFPNPVTTTFENSSIEQTRPTTELERKMIRTLFRGFQNYARLFTLSRIREHSESLGSRRAYIKRVVVPHTLSFIRHQHTRRAVFGDNTVKIR